MASKVAVLPERRLTGRLVPSLPVAAGLVGRKPLTGRGADRARAGSTPSPGARRRGRGARPQSWAAADPVRGRGPQPEVPRCGAAQPRCQPPAHEDEKYGASDRVQRALVIRRRSSPCAYAQDA